jgi:hypothetical protein
LLEIEHFKVVSPETTEFLKHPLNKGFIKGSFWEGGIIGEISYFIK